MIQGDARLRPPGIAHVARSRRAAGPKRQRPLASILGSASVLRFAGSGAPAPVVMHGWRSRLVAPLLLALFAVLVCARMPEILIKGRFWAEEGRNFLPAALAMPPLAALLHPYGGYLNLVANAAMLAASRLMPLSLAPYLTIAVGLFFQLLPPWLLLTSRDPWLRSARTRAAGVLLLLLIPASEEVWLQTLHCQFELTLACGIILALEPATGPAAAARWAILLLAPLCGPGAISLAPLFLARAAIDRSGARLLQGLVLAGGSAIQLACFTAPFAGRQYGLDPLVMLCILSVRHVTVPFFGLAAAHALTDNIRAALRAGHLPLLGMLPALLMFAPLASAMSREPRATSARWLLAAASLSACASYYGAIDGAARLIHVTCGERYVFVPQALLALAILALAATASRKVACVATVAVIWLIAVGASNFRSTSPEINDGPSWRAEIRAWQHDPSHVVRLWPQGWSVALNRS